MNYEIEFDSSNLEKLISESDKIQIQAAMANRFASIVHNNFGMQGEDRPIEWRNLKEKYALEYHYGDTTPTLQLNGDLQSSVEVDESSPDASSVFTVSPYASDHQWGNPEKNLPARPFFPLIDENTLTDYSESEVVRAASNELERILSR